MTKAPEPIASLNLQVRSGGGELPALAAGVQDWLGRQPAFAGAHPVLENVRYIAGAGSANESVLAELVTRRGGGEQRQEVALKVLTKHMSVYMDSRLERQVKIIDWMGANSDIPVPTFLATDITGEAVGRPFLMMKRIHGQAAIDFPGFNVTGFIFDMSEDERRALWNSAIDMLCRVHRVDSSGIDFLDFPGTKGAAMDDYLTHWRNCLDWAGEDMDQDFFGAVWRWLRETVPQDAPKGLSWGDARIGNMLFQGTKCVGVLDWEMASMAGPLIDVAWGLLFDRIGDEDTGVPRLPGLGSRQETLERWEAGTGLSTRHIVWHDVLALYVLSITRAKNFGDRRRAGQPTPADTDTRSVLRLRRRIEAILGADKFN